MDANYTVKRGKMIEHTKALCAFFIATAKDQSAFELVSATIDDHSCLNGDVMSGD